MEMLRTTSPSSAGSECDSSRQQESVQEDQGLAKKRQEWLMTLDDDLP